jgi:hypothetical protein
MGAYSRRLARYVSGAAGVFLIALACACVPEPPSTSAPGSTASRPPFIGAYFGSSDGAALVYFLLPDGPAARAGMQEGDRLVSFGPRTVASAEDVQAGLRGTPPNSTVPVVVMRDGQRQQLSVQVAPAEALRDKQWETFFAARETSELQAGDQAERAGDKAAAFGHYVRASRAAAFLPAGPDAAYERLAALVPTMRPAPSVPAEAERHSQRAMSILRTANSARDNDRAASEIRSALFAAPWVADLHLNYGVVLEHIGYPKAAGASLRRYLLFNPRASDAASVRQRIVDLELLAEELEPWRRFVGGQWSQSDSGGTFTVALRGRTLTATVVVARADADQKPGDVICTGTVNGTRFEGRCSLWSTNPEAKRCFGARREYEADGGIEGGELRIMSTTNLNFGTSTCIINSENRGARIWIKPRTS